MNPTIIWQTVRELIQPELKDIQSSIKDVASDVCDVETKLGEIADLLSQLCEHAESIDSTLDNSLGRIGEALETIARDVGV